VVRISEVLFNPVGTPERLLEWVELEYLGSAPLLAEGWRLQDNREFDPLPTLELVPGRLHQIAGRSMVLTGEAAGVPVSVVSDQSLGNGLANTGDRLVLRGAAGEILDALPWGDDTSVNQPARPAVAEEHSLQWVANGSPAACGWEDNPKPSPGLPNRPAPTHTPTPSITATVTATGTITPTATASSTPAPTGTPMGTPAPSQAATPPAAQESAGGGGSLPSVPTRDTADSGSTESEAAIDEGATTPPEAQGAISPFDGQPRAVPAVGLGSGVSVPTGTPELRIAPPAPIGGAPTTLDGEPRREYAQSEPPHRCY